MKYLKEKLIDVLAAIAGIVFIFGVAICLGLPLKKLNIN